MDVAIMVSLVEPIAELVVIDEDAVRDRSSVLAERR